VFYVEKRIPSNGFIFVIDLTNARGSERNHHIICEIYVNFLRNVLTLLGE
jgi:hypothetical protein